MKKNKKAGFRHRASGRKEKWQALGTVPGRFAAVKKVRECVSV
jgi:hypothetical protein